MQRPPMRKSKRLLSRDETDSILKEADCGVLSLVAPDGTPYGVPLSFVFLNGRICFHCAREGFKTDCLRTGSMVHFTVIGRHHPAYIKNFTLLYESVMVFGTAHELGGDEKNEALHALALKYLPGFMDHADEDIANSFSRTAVWAIDPESITGKAKR